MANMINQVIIQGNLVKDPDYREFKNGKGSVCTLRIASSREYISNGQKHEETVFVDIRSYGKLAVSCRQFLCKGSPMLCVGRLFLDQWQTKDGQSRQTLLVNAENIQFLSGKSRQNANTQTSCDEDHDTDYAAEEDCPF